MNKVKLSMSLHPNVMYKLRLESEKYNVTPQILIKQLIRRYYEIDPDTGEYPVYTKTNERLYI